MAYPVRIGAVNYLNTKPLICDLEQLAPQAELVLDVPSRLADLLAEGQLDVALIPVLSYFQAGCYSVVPNIAIASRGPVLSVTLFSRTPWTAIRRVALDAGSRTSAALTQILLGKRYGVAAEVTSLPLDGQAEDADADAVLLIGDRAMRACLPGFQYAFDLGQEWFDWTGLPFVYAVWAVREGVDLGGWTKRCSRPRHAAWTARARSRMRRHRGWAWMPGSAAVICPPSCILTWGRTSRPDCAASTHGLANWDWRPEE